MKICLANCSYIDNIMRIDSESISHTWFVKKKKYTYMNKYSKYTSISKQNVEIDFKKKQKKNMLKSQKCRDKNILFNETFTT